MKRRIKVPEFITLHDDEDKPFRVRFEYDPGEDQWFDAQAGVGSPGYPASVDLYEIDFGKGWEPIETYPQLNTDQIEQKVWEEIGSLEEAFWAGYAESMESER